MTLALLIFLFPLAYSPGPGNMFFAANGARFGFWATVPANIGYHIATWLMTMAVGAGFIALFSDYPMVFLGIRMASALYVLWLAWGLFNAGPAGAVGEPRVAGFWDGVILLVLNSKAYVLMALIYTQFGAEGRLFWVATIFTANNIVAFCLFALAGEVISSRFVAEPWGNRVLGAMLAVVAVWMLFL